MASIRACELPADALLRRYLGGGAYADCYVTELARPVSHAEFVEAFYTTAVFKLERLLLAWFVARPSTDAQAAELACGKRASFAAWRVEARQPDQVLLSDFQGRTRSWLMNIPAANHQSTRLFFGSAVVPIVDRRSGEARMGAAFGALLGFHKIYSRVLLRAALARLARSKSYRAMNRDLRPAANTPSQERMSLHIESGSTSPHPWRSGFVQPLFKLGVLSSGSAVVRAGAHLFQACRPFGVLR